MAEWLRDDLDAFAEEHGYSGRSAVIREACQSLLAEYEQTDYEGQQVLATVTVVFGYDKPKIEGRMMELRHKFEASIRSNSHNCLGDNAGCVETFVVEAAYDDVLRFIATVRGAGESVSVEYTLVPVDVMSAEVSDSDSF
ncbi:nickel-responsive transcriptional regulator NikR [Haloferax sp. Atlit-10N]|uniref:NikR family transcription regulator n=1 Tax=Haloferax prahovense (strain DSM 18310 / JCM 13924 / TL6) TaxID=1227461 RepID=M0GC54_HALPT|nr:NikR family transcription regulator [Haloferax prahovense DSM 18310]RDZ42198.1 nickel-responsive transcriptional regulator NikR [Haloferax sp. Atlit-19N]RDZ42484.1 nickel-responsive transcriptional regulator NikR [Haloferax sp. Atlit-16N]RDZ57357.1 nickel-responsive transcriptional regulator NikR [Haloferax sp. Atlit-10N]